MYHILSIEDDPREEQVLKSHIERYANEHGLDLKLTWEPSAFDFAGGERHFDLIFFDIELPGINGMEAAALLRSYDRETPIVFVTNLAQYAVKGYEVDALDFMVKPVSYQDFCLRMDKAMRAVRHNEGASIMVSTGEGFRFVSARSIVYIDISNHELAYHLESGEVLRTRETLKHAEEQLGNTTIVRISNSCLVNMAHIRRIVKDELVLSNGDSVWFSRSRKRAALQSIARYAGGSI